MALVGALRRNEFCRSPSKHFRDNADWIFGTRFATFSGYTPLAALMPPPAKSGDRKVFVVIFVVEREICVELRHRRAAFAISV
jgi:hypothetical protein